MASCREIEKMVMPYINHQLDEVQLEQFLKHIKSCSSCREELEIYYTVSLGLRQLDSREAEFMILPVPWKKAWRMPGSQCAQRGFVR
ncbi:MAG: anti-sigma factor family protein [Clostridium sp.]